MHFGAASPLRGVGLCFSRHGVMDCRASQICCGTADSGRRMDRKPGGTSSPAWALWWGVAYTWRALQKAFFSDVPQTAHELEIRACAPLRTNHLAGDYGRYSTGSSDPVCGPVSEHFAGCNRAGGEGAAGRRPTLTDLMPRIGATRFNRPAIQSLDICIRS